MSVTFHSAKVRRTSQIIPLSERSKNSRYVILESKSQEVVLKKVKAAAKCVIL